MKQIILILLLTVASRMYGQNSCNYLNCVISIDNTIVSPPSFSKGFILIKDENNKVEETVNFDYNIGTITFTDDEFKRVQNIDPSKKIILKFTAAISAPKFKSYEYQIDLEAAWLKQSFMIIKIFNFGNNINRKTFPQKNGYGIEFSTAAFSTKLPRLSPHSREYSKPIK